MISHHCYNRSQQALILEVCGVQDFYMQADSLKAGKAHLAGPAPEMPSSLSAAVRSGKRMLVLTGALLLGCLVLYVMWPRGAGFNYGYDGVEETEHFVTVSGTQVSLPPILLVLSPACVTERSGASCCLQGRVGSMCSL